MSATKKRFNPLEYFSEEYLSRRLFSNVMRNGCCIFWMGARNADGYGMLILNKKAQGLRGRLIRTHQLSWVVHRGPIPDGMSVLHRCDRPACIEPSHLFLGTHADNMRDMAAKGRRKGIVGECGVTHHGAILNPEIVARAREAAKSHGGLSAMARETGFKYGTLWAAAHKHWRVSK